jgi:hypothetical protein
LLQFERLIDRFAHLVGFEKQFVEQREAVCEIKVTAGLHRLCCGALIQVEAGGPGDPGDGWLASATLPSRCAGREARAQQRENLLTFIIGDTVHVGTAPTAQRIAITASTPAQIAITVVAFIAHLGKRQKRPFRALETPLT